MKHVGYKSVTELIFLFVLCAMDGQTARPRTNQLLISFSLFLPFVIEYMCFMFL